MNPYSSLCDDFHVQASLNTKLEVPPNREILLHFFDSVRKAFPTLTDFECRENNEIMLEEDRDLGTYRWVGLDKNRVSSGYVNPPSLEEADLFHERVLEMAPYHLTLTALDCEGLDVAFAFDFFYKGNHDEVVAEALGLGNALEPMSQIPNARVLSFEPSIMFALDETCRLQCRLNVETRTNAYQLRTGQFADVPISVYFTVRQYWARQGNRTFVEGYQQQRKLVQELVDAHVIPAVVQPLYEAIEKKGT